jgi:hypothetical protein
MPLLIHLFGIGHLPLRVTLFSVACFSAFVAKSAIRPTNAGQERGRIGLDSMLDDEPKHPWPWEVWMLRTSSSG